MEKVIIFGIGKIGKKYVDYCIEQGVKELELVDSNNGLWGTEYRGRKISSPAEISWQEYDLVVTAVNDANRAEIIDQLVTVHRVPKEKIVSWRETIVLSDKEIYNWGDMAFDKTVDTGKILTGIELSIKLEADSLNDLEKFCFLEKHKCINKLMHYFEAYDRFFQKYRGKNVTILEIGVNKGGSLQMWKKYFNTSNNKVQVYGIDIDPACKMLEEENIEIFIGSQEDREFLKNVKKRIGKVDILIDDGGHTMNQQIVTFEELFDLVDEEGIYLCEDTHTSYMERYGGEYRGTTFIEYSKNFIDLVHVQYSETDELARNKYSDEIKFITYCDSMVFIEKKKKTTKSISVCVERQ